MSWRGGGGNCNWPLPLKGRGATTSQISKECQFWGVLGALPKISGFKGAPNLPGGARPFWKASLPPDDAPPPWKLKDMMIFLGSVSRPITAYITGSKGALQTIGIFYLFIYLFICLSIYVPTYLPIHLFIYLSVSLSVYLSIHSFILLFFHSF